MRRPDHERIMRAHTLAWQKRCADESQRAAAFWRAEAERLQEVADIYARTLDELEAKERTR